MEGEGEIFIIILFFWGRGGQLGDILYLLGGGNKCLRLGKSCTYSPGENNCPRSMGAAQSHTLSVIVICIGPGKGILGPLNRKSLFLFIRKSFGFNFHTL